MTAPYESWLPYFQATQHHPPSDLLMTALPTIEQDKGVDERYAVDLGCGAGRDTRELVRRGWQVLAVDKEAAAFDYIRTALTPEQRDRLTTQTAAFEGLKLPVTQLVNAAFSIPFCHPDDFSALWAEIVRSLAPNGWFVGNLFGNHDEWAGVSSVTTLTRAQVDALLQPFHVHVLDEVEFNGPGAIEPEKHWHLFRIIARRNANRDTEIS